MTLGPSGRVTVLHIALAVKYLPVLRYSPTVARDTPSAMQRTVLSPVFMSCFTFITVPISKSSEFSSSSYLYGTAIAYFDPSKASFAAAEAFLRGFPRHAQLLTKGKELFLPSVEKCCFILTAVPCSFHLRGCYQIDHDLCSVHTATNQKMSEITLMAHFFIIFRVSLFEIL